MDLNGPYLRFAALTSQLTNLLSVGDVSKVPSMNVATLTKLY